MKCISTPSLCAGSTPCLRVMSFNEYLLKCKHVHGEMQTAYVFLNTGSHSVIYRLPHRYFVSVTLCHSLPGIAYLDRQCPTGPVPVICQQELRERSKENYMYEMLRNHY